MSLGGRNKRRGRDIGQSIVGIALILAAVFGRRLEQLLDVQKNVSVGDERAEVVEKMKPNVVDDGTRQSRAEVMEKNETHGFALVETESVDGGDRSRFLD